MTTNVLASMVLRLNEKSALKPVARVREVPIARSEPMGVAFLRQSKSNLSVAGLYEYNADGAGKSTKPGSQSYCPL
jgi:hypothetical protein